MRYGVHDVEKVLLMGGQLMEIESRKILRREILRRKLLRGTILRSRGGERFAPPASQREGRAVSLGDLKPCSYGVDCHGESTKILARRSELQVQHRHHRILSNQGQR